MPSRNAAAPAAARIAGREMSIDELARRAATTTRNVRLYQTHGLLPPPRRSGRVAYYDGGHLARLRLIARLQGRGFSLASIRELLHAWSDRRSLADVLGLEEQITAPWNEEKEEVLGLAELADRFLGGDRRLLGRAVDLGLLAIEGARARIPRPSLLRVAEALVDAGIPPSAALAEFEAVKERLDRTAAEFVELFARYVWRPFVENGMPPERLPVITESVGRLRPLAAVAVSAILAQSLDEASGAGAAEEARRIVERGRKEERK